MNDGVSTAARYHWATAHILNRAFDLFFVVTGTFFNSAWKYRERAFR
jgi:hypothetical protein